VISERTSTPPLKRADGKKCVYIATEEESRHLPGRDIGRDVRSSTAKIYDIPPPNVALQKDSLQSDIVSLVEKIPKDAELVVIDNLGVFTLNMSMDEFRKQLDTLNLLLAKQTYTSLYIMDDTSNKRTEGVAAYSAYGVIRLVIKENPYTSMRERHLEVAKMRSTSIPLESYTFDITSGGIEILKRKGVWSL
jgi:KaiC/GvpD/RAD55 family RecA-like ATPase